MLKDGCKCAASSSGSGLMVRLKNAVWTNISVVRELNA